MPNRTPMRAGCQDVLLQSRCPAAVSEQPRAGCHPVVFQPQGSAGVGDPIIVSISKLLQPVLIVYLVCDCCDAVSAAHELC